MSNMSNDLTMTANGRKRMVSAAGMHWAGVDVGNSGGGGNGGRGFGLHGVLTA